MPAGAFSRVIVEHEQSEWEVLQLQPWLLEQHLNQLLIKFGVFDLKQAHSPSPHVARAHVLPSTTTSFIANPPTSRPLLPLSPLPSPNSTLLMLPPCAPHQATSAYTFSRTNLNTPFSRSSLPLAISLSPSHILSTLSLPIASPPSLSEPPSPRGAAHAPGRDRGRVQKGRMLVASCSDCVRASPPPVRRVCVLAPCECACERGGGGCKRVLVSCMK